MAKQIASEIEARALLLEGVDTLVRAVGVTLGPGGRNVVLDQEFGPPKVCSDGATIAKEIELKEPFPNMGVQLVKEAASKTNDDVGDGTTTSTVLAQNILHEGFRLATSGVDPMALKRGLDIAASAVKKQIESQAQAVNGIEEVRQVAILSAHEEAMGNIIADVLNNVGQNGVVTVEDSRGLNYDVEYVEGMEIDRGYLSPYLVTNQDKMIAELEDPYILITSEKISAAADLVPILEKLSAVSRNIVVIAEDIEGEALATLVVNKTRGNLNCLAIKAPAFGDRRKAMLEDMAVLFNANVISSDIGRTLDSVEISDLGRCRRVISNKDNTTFVEGVGDAEIVKNRVSQIIESSKEVSSDYDREKLEERAAKMSGGVAVIKVGAATEIELREKRQRVEDAIAATRAAMAEGIIAGGGTALVRAAQALKGELENDDRDVMNGINLMLKACEYPVKVIAENAGYSGEVILNGVINGKDDWGFDAERNQFGNMKEMGIIDPVKVTKSVIDNAASVAGMVLTTEFLITELNPPPLPAPYDD